MISLRAGLRNAVREGSRFQNVIAEIERTQWLTQEELRELQWVKTHALLVHAAKHVAYYKESFCAAGVDITSIKSLDDVKLLPPLVKAVVASRGRDLVARNMFGPRIRINTSGTTNTPLVIYQNLNAVIRENAFIWRQLTWAGFSRGQRRAWIRGDMIVPIEQKGPPFWRFNRGDNMLMMSSYHLSESSAAAYITALQHFDPVLIQAYPSSMAYLARYLDSAGRWYQGKNLRGIVTTSEMLTNGDREIIESRVGCRVFEQYGVAERVTMIQTCEHGGRHVNSDYALTELIPREDGTCEVVGTGFNNWLMPLIRYRTGDAVELEVQGIKCKCGRELPLVKQIYGRLEEYLKTRDGRRIGRVTMIFEGLRGIAEAQVVQERIDEVTVRLVPFGDFGNEEREKLVSRAQERLGREMQINIDVVPFIPRTKSGKFRSVICNV